MINTFTGQYKWKNLEFEFKILIIQLHNQFLYLNQGQHGGTVVSTWICLPAGAFLCGVWNPEDSHKENIQLDYGRKPVESSAKTVGPQIIHVLQKI